MPTNPQPPLGTKEPAPIGWRSAGSNPWIGIGLIIVAVVLAWANSVSAPFVLDDVSSIVTNTSIRDLASFHWIAPPFASGETVGGRPILNLTFAANYAIGGLDVRWFHVTNTAIHAMAALALFGVVRRTILLSKATSRFHDNATRIALAASLVWAVHPLQTEAVTYVVQRAESLAGMFYLLTLYCFIRSLDTPAQKLRWTAGSVLACFLGVATKETVVTAPVVILLYDRVFIAGSLATAWRARWRTYVMIASSWIILAAVVVMHSGRGGSAGLGSSAPVWNYLLTQCNAIVRYGSLAFWPARQVFDYGTYLARGVSEVIPELVLISIAGSATVWALWRNHVSGFLAACFFLALAPSSSFVPVATQTIAEHRMYLALAPLVLLTAVGLMAAIRRPGWLGYATVCLVLILGFITVARNKVYGSAYTLWQDTVAKAPNNPRAHNNLGLVLAKMGRAEDAKARFLQALNLQANEWQPNQAVAHFNLGNLLMAQRRWDEAVPEFEAALTANPQYTNARVNLSQTLAHLGRNNEAINQLRKVLQEENGAQDARTNLASLLIAEGKNEEGMLLLREVLRAAPDWAAAHYHLGIGLEKSGNVAAAETEFQTALRLDPNFAQARLALGNIALDRGDVAAAETFYREAIRLDSGLIEAQFALGNVLAQQQQFQAAMTAYRRALAADPKHIQARTNLANCQLATGEIPEAIANFREVLRLQPQEETAQQNLAIALQMLSQQQH